jgi:hypothetical protein
VTLAPERVYLNDPECLLLVFDLRQPGVAEALHNQRAAWPEYSDIEALDEDHFALLMRPGWASEPAV